MDHMSGIEKVAAVMESLSSLTWRDLPETRLILAAGSLLAEWDLFVAKKPPYDNPLQSRVPDRPQAVAWDDFINRIRLDRSNNGSRIRIVNSFRREGIGSWESLLCVNNNPDCWRNFGPVSMRLLRKIMKECGVDAPDHWEP